MRTHPSTRIALTARLACGLLLAGGAAARAEVTPDVVVNLGTAAPEDTPWSKQLNRIKKRIETDSAGKVKLRLFLGSVKGGEDAMARQLAQGSLQMAGLTTAALAILAPELDVLELPYRFSSSEEADRVLDDPEVWALVQKILRKKGLEPYVWSENGWRNYASKKRPILVPADLKGMKMRAQENRVHIGTYEALGASPVPISVPETLSSLQTGVVDGFDNTALYAFAASWYEGIKHWTISDHIYQPALLVFNKAWLDAQPESVKTVLLANAKEEQEYGRGLIRKLTPKLLENLTASGVTVHTLTKEQRDLFAAATLPVHQKIRAAVSDDGKALFDLIARKLKTPASAKPAGPVGGAAAAAKPVQVTAGTIKTVDKATGVKKTTKKKKKKKIP